MNFFSRKKFSDPLDTAVYTTIHVIDHGSVITLISHELDGDWQFMGGEPITDYEKVAKIVSLAEIIKSDKTVLKVADLPKGYQAIRSDKNSKWEVVKIEYSEEEIAEMGFYCSGCGKYHREIPMAYGADAPYPYREIPEGEHATRCQLDNDTCIIDDSQFFIIGNLLIPVEGAEDFSWNVWVNIPDSTYAMIADNWDNENRVLTGPFDGWLATSLEIYPGTLNLPVKLHIQKVGYRPKIEVMECSHPLFLEQENGITKERVIEFAKKILYNHQ